MTDSVPEVGLEVAILGRLMNRSILRRRVPEDMGRAWIAHDIEEVGQLESFLPARHAALARA